MDRSTDVSRQKLFLSSRKFFERMKIKKTGALEKNQTMNLKHFENLKTNFEVKRFPSEDGPLGIVTFSNLTQLDFQSVPFKCLFALWAYCNG